jgi:hypothetical protein
MWLEWYTATGSTGVTATISYTNQAGTAGQTTTVSVGASQPANSCLFAPLAAGDTGVQSVQSVLLSATTGTAGNFGVTLGYPYMYVWQPLPANTRTLDYAKLGLPTIQPNAAIAFLLFQYGGSAAGDQVMGDLWIAQG